MKWSRSVVSNSLWPHGLQPTRLLRPWDSPGKNTGVGCHFLLQGIFPTQGSNPGLPHCRQMLYHLSHQGSHLLLPTFHSFWTAVLEKTLESPLDCKEIQPVHPKGDQSWVFIGRTDAKAETPILWPPHANSLIHQKSPWCWERLRAGGKEGIRGWDGWMASLMQWTWTWANFRRWWGTGRPSVL